MTTNNNKNMTLKNIILYNFCNTLFIFLLDYSKIIKKMILLECVLSLLRVGLRDKIYIALLSS
jgi:hypothetical protein